MFIQDSASNFDKTEKPTHEFHVSMLKDVLAANGRRLWIRFWDVTEAGKETDTSSFEGIL